MKKMKKLKNAGFTLIELLAVITIMGILMMVAIPSVTRTIANSRRDTFADIALRYIDSARNMYVGDNIKCNVNGKWTPASAAPQGVYYIPICTDGTEGDNCASITIPNPDTTKDPDTFDVKQIADTTAALLEKGGKSSFGSAEMRGYIRIEKTSITTEDGGKVSKENYSALFVDSGLHGFATPVSEENIDRSVVNAELGDSAKRTNVALKAVTTGTGEDAKTTYETDTGAHVCKVV